MPVLSYNPHKPCPLSDETQRMQALNSLAARRDTLLRNPNPTARQRATLAELTHDIATLSRCGPDAPEPIEGLEDDLGY
ncbi:MAG: hypothetical protein WAZ18_02255 [Alphaproteobacteria bacterium]